MVPSWQRSIAWPRGAPQRESPGGFTFLLGALSVRDTDFRRWWADHDVVRYSYGTKRLHHPVVGDLTLDYEALAVTDDPEQSLSLHTAEPGSPSEQALRLLASWTGEPARWPTA